MDRSSWEQDTPAATDAEQFGDIIESVTTTAAGEYDVVLVGEPYDRGTVTRRGARDGPAAIRMALADVDTHHLDAGPVDSVGDVGSVEIPFGASVATAREPVRETVDALHDSDAVPLIIGGDSSLTVANVAGLLGMDTATDGGYATDGGERTDGPRGSSELRSDGGFGDDEESVGDVEHFDPATAEDSADDEKGEDSSADEDAADDTETDETPADDEDDESETETDDVGGEDEETADASEPDGEERDDAADIDDETDEDADEETTEHDDTGDAEDTEESEETGFDTSEQAETEVIEGTTTVADSSTGSVGVIRLSARLDCQPVGSDPTNRSAVRQLFEAGVDSLAVVGARHFESATAEADAFRDNGGDVVTAEEVGDDPVEAADRALGTVEDAEHVYVSIDLSVLDATAAPGASDPSPGGLQTRELFRVVRLLASDDRLAGLELVETAPTHDRDDQTAEAAARTAAHAIAALRE